jgi:hypothetical protein
VEKQAEEQPQRKFERVFRRQTVTQAKEEI